MATPPLTGKACKTAPGSLSYAARCTFTRRSNTMNQLSPAQTSLQQSCTRRDACARAVLQYDQWYILMECVGMEKNNCVRDVTKRLGKEDECGPSARAPSSPEKKFLFGASLIWSRGSLLSGSSGKVLKNSFPPTKKSAPALLRTKVRRHGYLLNLTPSPCFISIAAVLNTNYRTADKSQRLTFLSSCRCVVASSSSSSSSGHSLFGSCARLIGAQK